MQDNYLLSGGQAIKILFNSGEMYMADTQQEYAKFEELSEYIVRHIFKDTDAVIRKTLATKDGGYDIVVKYSDGKGYQKVYFECKLRNRNLNLRDIAANVIIAFNEGAVTMVAFTNHDYTIQMDEHLRHFLKKTILNIKIIIGNDINLLVHKYNIPLSDTLSKLISPKHTNRKFIDNLLQIDFSKENLHEQILHRELPHTTISDIVFIPKQLKTKMMTAQTILRQGGLLTVSGFMGIGKHAFVESVISEFDYVIILIDASLHKTQERILLDILFSIWGISITNIIEDFTDIHIDTIIKRLSRCIKNKKMLHILQRILGDKRIKGINDENYNLLICDYIVDISQLHKNMFNYLFVFENLSYANNENSVLLTYLIKCLSRKEIPCVIIQDSEEYAVQRSFDLKSEFGQLPNFMIIELNAYTISEAIEYIRKRYPEMPIFIAEEIIKQVGTRKTNISMFLDYIQTIGISMTDNKRIAYELQTIQSNALPTIASKVLDYYRQQGTSVLFDILFLFQGKIADQMCDKLSVNPLLLEQLIKGNILVHRQGYYVCANRIVHAIIIDEWGVDDSPRLRQLAAEILQVLGKESSIVAYDSKAYLLRYTGAYKQALETLIAYIDYLENERQFDELINSCDLAIELCHRMNEPIEWMKWTIYQLRILNAQKAILTPKATVRLNELSDNLARYAYLKIPHHYFLANDYFRFTIDFKNGFYDIYTENGLKMQCYFYDTVCGKETDNHDDWLGNICNRYVLYIKENEGNDVALVAYNRVRKALPESVQLWRGYYSHLACMCLYIAPSKAFDYYEKIIAYIHKTKGLHTLPFHEYVDRAMSKFLSSDIVLAEAFTRDALDICEANAILDEWGRCLNILGCIFVCQDRSVEAKSLFKESMEMLKVSGYKLFSWRSQLNYLHVALKDGDDCKQLSMEFADAYQCFVSLLKTKVIALLQKETEEFVQSREYHALLSFGLYHSKIYGLTNNPILGDFKLGYHQARYQDDLQILQNTPSLALPNSPFFRSGMIMAIG
jgi:hypothetical protein